MFCCSTPTASDPSFSTTGYVPVSDCKPGDTCAPHSGLNKKLSCWRIKYYMRAPRDTWVHWFQSPIYKAGWHCVLPAPVALWWLPSGSLPSVAGLSWLLFHASGTPCQRRRRQLSRWRHSVSISRHGFSASRIQISSSDLSTDCLTAFCVIPVTLSTLK